MPKKQEAMGASEPVFFLKKKAKRKNRFLMAPVRVASLNQISSHMKSFLMIDDLWPVCGICWFTVIAQFDSGVRITIT